ncbi:MAG TPA: Holliday junction resolvase RuvX [Ignavibacteriaceae bacterium]|nr:Holliday junction resolvase RuvX [Ignavibacteriaceae bacterium]
MADDSSYHRIMAVDYGKKRIGIALTDPLLTFAYPFKTLLNDKNFWHEFTSIVEGQNVSKIILGLPLKENGEEYELTATVFKFKAEIEKKLRIEVLVRDERYTSSIALEMINANVSKKSKRRDKSLIDQSAAAIILQDYLNEKK